MNLRAAWTFSINDFLSNLSIVVAGVLVHLLRRNWPDLVVRLAIAGVAAYGGIEILPAGSDGARSMFPNARAGYDMRRVQKR
ncbi:MAG: hypothetical protein H0X69_11885 [Gemmatimonadales bacterium]|nr:hypothetical protein [Gemmatimonadales bacterium]